MFILIGHKRGIYPGEEDEEDGLALFTTYEKAQKYVEKAALKGKDPHGFSEAPFKVFRKRSLLHPYSSAYIEAYEEPNYEVDPEI